MGVGEDLINASPHIQDKQAFIQGLNSISDELGVSRDFLPIIMMTEAGTDGINPAANNGDCGGLIQFCNGTGASEVGSTAGAISSMSAVDQLPLIRQYLSTKGIPKGADLATTYLSILYPVAMKEGRDASLSYIPPQAEHLYGPGGSLTKETIEAGLLGRAQTSANALGGAAPSGDGKFTPLPNKGAGNTQQGGTPASLGTNGGSVIIGTYTRDCSKTPPWDWTMQMGKIYRGCSLKITTLGIQGGMSSTPMYGAPNTGSSKASLKGAVLVSNVSPPKAGTLLSPVPGAPETSPFGMRNHPIHGGQKLHKGVDLGAPDGTPIIAPMDGVISEMGNDANGYGTWLAVKHADGSIGETFYAHLSRYADLPVGTVVKAGQVIGYTGNTGSSTGGHLHFEVRDPNGNLIDPDTVLQR